MLELDSALAFDAARTEEDFFPALPAHPAVCLIEPRDQKAEPFLIRTQNLRRRLERLLGPANPASKRLNLRGATSPVESATGSPARGSSKRLPSIGRPDSGSPNAIEI